MIIAQPLSKFVDVLPGVWTIVGNGPTRYELECLADEPGPVAFVNQAVGWAVGDGRPEFHACTDLERLAECGRHGVTDLLARSGRLDFGARPMGDLEAANRLARKRGECWHAVAYRWDNPRSEAERRAFSAQLATRSKLDVAADEQLHQHSGTVHPLVHFAWLCGANRVRLIGCDGSTPGYDDRHAIETSAASEATYAKIRRELDRMAEVLGLDLEYVGTP